VGVVINQAQNCRTYGPPWTIESPPSTETVFNGKTCLYFGGTSYYGLHADQDLMKAGFNAWKKLGHGTATSRNGMGTSPLYRQVEKAVSEYFGTEAAAYLPTGYLSNLAGLKALYESGSFDVIFIDEDSHFSAFDAAFATTAPVYRTSHCSPEDLEVKLRKHLQPGQIPLMVSDGLFPTLGQIAPVPEWVNVLEPYDGRVWLDEAHTMGVLGTSGRGSYDYFGLTGDHLLCGGTLSKAFGGFGGVIPGSDRLIKRILSGPVMNGANPMPPPLAAATLAGIKQLAANPQWRERLWANARLLKKGISDLGFETEDNDVPIAAFALDSEDSMKRVQGELFNRGIAIQHAHYTGVGEAGVLRAVVFSTHMPDQIQHLIDELGKLV